MREAMDGCVWGLVLSGLPPAENTRPSTEPGKLNEAIPTQVPDAGSLLLAEDGVFRCFGDAELDHALRWDLNFRAGLRIPSHAGFAIHQHQLAEARYRKGVFGLLIRQGGKVFKKLRGGFLGESGFAGHMLGNLCLRHRFGHERFLLNPGVSVMGYRPRCVAEYSEYMGVMVVLLSVGRDVGVLFLIRGVLDLEKECDGEEGDV